MSIDNGVNPALVNAKKEHLCNILAKLESVSVAYSGGVDSSLLSYYARKILGNKALIIIAVSPSLAQSELEFARVQGKQFNWDILEISTEEVEKPEYKTNNEMRCYFCKTELFTCMQKIAQEKNIANLAYGANINDLSDFRPGHEAARQFNVLSPLQDAQLDKEEIRYLAKEAGLPSWDRPQAACLSSRFPTFTPITIEKLALVDKAESVLKNSGIKQVRVRHYNNIARVEIDKKELPSLLADEKQKTEILHKIKELGYTEVIIDPQGYRQGSANKATDRVQQI